MVLVDVERAGIGTGSLLAVAELLIGIGARDPGLNILRVDRHRVVKIAGPEGAAVWSTITPLQIQGDFDVLIDVTSDSLLRQERRAEAQSLVQTLAGVAQVAALSGTAINMQAPIEALLDAFDVTDKASYFLPAAPGGPPTAPPGVAPPPGGNGSSPTVGVTNPEAAAGPLAPSNVASMSPEASMQRFMAQRGTPASG